MRRLAATACLVLALAGPGAALAADAGAWEPSPRSVSAVATPDKVRLGEAFTLTLEIRDDPAVRYELPAALSLGQEFDVVRITPSRQEKDGVLTTRFVIEALVFDLGEKTLADLQLAATGPRGAGVLTVPGPKVTGTGDLKEDEEASLLDILPPVEVLVPKYTVLWVAGGALLATLLVLALVRWLKNRPRKVKAVPVVPRAPAHERALQALQELQQADLPAQDRAKEFHFRLSEILRDYLGERFGFQALDMTTEELLTVLQRTSTPGLDYPRFEAFCREGDLVKYAKLPATGAGCKAAIEAGFEFVRATVPPAARPGGAT